MFKNLLLKCPAKYIKQIQIMNHHSQGTDKYKKKT